jgi:hypothetical protein
MSECHRAPDITDGCNNGWNPIVGCDADLNFIMLFQVDSKIGGVGVERRKTIVKFFNWNCFIKY